MTSDNEFIYSKRDFHYIFYLFLIIIGIIGFIYVLINFFFFSEQNITGINLYTFAAIILIIIVFAIIFLSYSLFQDIFRERKLKISDWGIEYLIGEKIEITASWRNISLIRSCNIGEKVIFENKEWIIYNILSGHPDYEDEYQIFYIEPIGLKKIFKQVPKRKLMKIKKEIQ